MTTRKLIPAVLAVALLPWSLAQAASLGDVDIT